MAASSEVSPLGLEHCCTDCCLDTRCSCSSLGPGNRRGHLDLHRCHRNSPFPWQHCKQHPSILLCNCTSSQRETAGMLHGCCSSEDNHLSYSAFHSNRAGRHKFHYCRRRGHCISDHNLRGHTWLLTNRTHTDNAASHTFRERILPHTLRHCSLVQNVRQHRCTDH